MENNTTTALSPIGALREVQETGTISVTDPSESGESGESTGEIGGLTSNEGFNPVEQ